MFWNSKKKPQPPTEDPSSLGNLLIATGRCTPAQISEALQFQSDHPGMLLGEALVSLRLISGGQLEVAMARQKVHREGGGNGSAHDLADIAMKCSKEVTRSFDGVLAMAEKLK